MGVVTGKGTVESADGAETAGVGADAFAVTAAVGFMDAAVGVVAVGVVAVAAGFAAADADVLIDAGVTVATCRELFDREGASDALPVAALADAVAALSDASPPQADSASAQVITVIIVAAERRVVFVDIICIL